MDISKDPDFEHRLRIPEILLRAPVVDFVEGDHIIVSFDDSEPTSSNPDRPPFGFHVLEVGANSGTFGQKVSFKVLVPSQAIATGDGNFLVLAGEELKKFSGSFKELATVPTPLELHGRPKEQHVPSGDFLNPHYEAQQMDVSPNGQEVVLAHVKNPDQMEVRWLHTSDFTTIATAHVKPVRWQMSAGNQSVLFSENSKTSLLASSGEQAQICDHCLRAYFINDELVLQDERNKYEIKTMAGKTLVSGKLDQEAFKFHRAASATRFAYATGRYKGSGFPLKTHFAARMKVRVFDWKAMEQVAEVKFEESEKPTSTGFKLSAIALSPDGTRLVVLAGSILKCYQLQ